MKSLFLLTMSSLLVLMVVASPAAAQHSPDSILQRGREALEQGRTERALEIWMEARADSLPPDPRIGIAYLEAVSAGGLRAHFEFATYMYQWGLSGNRVLPFRETLLREIDMLEGMAGERELAGMRGSLDEGDPALLQDLRVFWNFRDPTPFTGANEALIGRRMEALDAPSAASPAGRATGLLPLPLDVTQYRLVDEAGDPYLATFMESRSQQAVRSHYMETFVEGDLEVEPGEDLMRHYDLRHGFRIFDGDDQLINRQRYPMEVVVVKGQSSTLYFTLPHRGPWVTQIFSASLYNRHPATAGSRHPLYEDGLIGLALQRLPQPPPLEPEPGGLVMGDLILGFRFDDGPEVFAGSDYGFTPATKQAVPAGAGLVLHAELYDPEGLMARGDEMRISLELDPAQKDIRWNRELEELHSLTRSLSWEGNRLAADLELPTGRLIPGRYLLSLVMDAGNGIRITREMPVSVVTTF